MPARQKVTVIRQLVNRGRKSGTAYYQLAAYLAGAEQLAQVADPDQVVDGMELSWREVNMWRPPSFLRPGHIELCWGSSCYVRVPWSFYYWSTDSLPVTFKTSRSFHVSVNGPGLDSTSCDSFRGATDDLGSSYTLCTSLGAVTITPRPQTMYTVSLRHREGSGYTDNFRGRITTDLEVLHD